MRRRQSSGISSFFPTHNRPLGSVVLTIALIWLTLAMGIGLVIALMVVFRLSHRNDALLRRIERLRKDVEDIEIPEWVNASKGSFREGA